MSDKKPYNSLTDDDDIHEADIVPGMQLRNTTVTKVRVEVTESNDRWKCKKYIHLLNGTQIISTYIKTSWDELSELEKLGEVSLSPFELEELQKSLPIKDDSEARRKAREAMAQRKSPIKSPKPKLKPPPYQPTSFTIQVNKPDGTNLTIPHVKANDTVMDIKKHIEDQENVPVNEQSLLHKGRRLDDKPDSSMIENGIKDGSILDLVEAPFTIKVTKPDGSSLTISGVKPSDTVINIKKKIKDKEGIPVGSQSLLHKNKKLDQPNSTMKENLISNGSLLHLVEPTFTLQVRKPDGQMIQILDVKADDTVLDIKNRIQKQEDLPVKAQWIFQDNKELDDPYSTMKENRISDGSVLDMRERPFEVQVKKPDGTKITVPNVLAGDTVLDIKKKIEDQEAIPVMAQWIFQDNKELDDPFSTMKDNRISDGSVLDMRERPFEVQVKKPDGTKITVPNVLAGDTVLDIKKKIEDQEAIPVKAQWLVYNDKPLDDPSATMDDLSIKDGSILQLEPMKIIVRPPFGRDIPLIVEPSTTLEAVQEMVVDSEAGVLPSVDHVRLSFRGTDLNETTATLESYNISNGSVLDLGEMQVRVRKPDGQVFTVTVMPLDSVKALKQKINTQKKGEVDEFKLFFNEKRLDDNPTLTDYKIGHGSTVDLDDTIRIKVRYHKGIETKLLALDVQPKETIEDVKKKLKGLTGIPTADQHLENNGDPLENDKNVSQSGIRDGCVLDLSCLGDKMQIHIKKQWDGKQVTMDVDKDDSIVSILDRIEEQEGVPKGQQHLEYAGLSLVEAFEGGRKTLHDFGIKHDSVLNLEKMKIFVRSPTGKLTLSDGVARDTALMYVKDMIEKKSGVEPKDQILSFGSVKLEDGGKTLSDYEILHKCTITLEQSDSNVPEFEVQLSPWKSSFDFVGKDGIKREGRRKKKPLGREY